MEVLRKLEGMLDVLFISKCLNKPRVHSISMFKVYEELWWWKLNCEQGSISWVLQRLPYLWVPIWDQVYGPSEREENCRSHLACCVMLMSVLMFCLNEGALEYAWAVSMLTPWQFSVQVWGACTNAKGWYLLPHSESWRKIMN